ncbi:hypothetical protein EIP91_006338 [Steccherinum ochraceum]|uniref:T6SS Phospholipase effector Tle1-like catalytic domain-containing protein n=1 Tax=Steccherinum ochraceum TaxID=92696 RepID=A0A4V2MVJ5_9APHY|nr:hypothetical protein EIP91_006338 [Steccherinum ochraceum]
MAIEGPALTESPSASTTSFKADYWFEQPDVSKIKRGLVPPPIASGSSEQSRFTSVSQDTAVDEDGLISPSDGAFWGERKRLWIPASSSPARAAHRHRTLVLFFDGTGDQFDGDNSNVVQFLAMLKKDNNNEQLVYYQTGIGTYGGEGFATPVAKAVSMTLDSMLAWNLPTHVKDGYAFLMQNYTEGDKICIFGFSRGAYTARALAGMLQKVGLLPVCNHQQLPFAFDMYARQDEDGLKLGHMFKKTFSRTVHVEFLGVWDTVASVGVIPQYLPFIHENTGVRHLRHALALDERRVKFLPQYCVAPDPKGEQHAQRHLFKRSKPTHQATLSKAYEDLINAQNAAFKPDVKEVWFAGVHTDVGGGSVPNGTRYSLARIPLRWMIRECFKCNTGILFDAAQLQQAGFRVFMKDGKPTLSSLPDRIVQHIPPFSGQRKYFEGQSLLSRTVQHVKDACAATVNFVKSFFWTKPTNPGALPVLDLDFPDQLQEQPVDYEAREELEDALSPLYDQLQARVTWHLLEWIPQRVKKPKAILQKAETGDSYHWQWNRGRGRKIPRHEMHEGLKIHRSVKTRLEASHRLEEEYVPQIRPELKKFVNGKKVKEAKRLTHEDWNVEDPKYWEWVD